MALRLSTGARNGLAGSKGFEELFNGGFIGLFSGSQPASADNAEGGGLLATISSSSGTGGIILGTAGGGIITKDASVMSGTCGTGGVAGWFRLYDSNKTTGSSGTAVRMDGNFGVSGSDMVAANTTLVAGATTTIDEFSLTVPANA
jgi:hypothetical protein